MSGETAAPKKYVSTYEAADAIGVNRSVIADWSKLPGFPGFSVAGPIGARSAKIRVNVDDLVTWLRQRNTQPAPSAEIEGIEPSVSDVVEATAASDEHRRRVEAAVSYQPDEIFAQIADENSDLSDLITSDGFDV